MFSLIATALYAATFAILLHQIAGKNPVFKESRSTLVRWLVGVGLVAHGVSAYLSIHTTDGYSFSFFKVPSLFFVAINFVVLLSSVKKPLHNLFIFLLPISIFALGLNYYEESPSTAVVHFSPGVFAHVILSVLAYSLLTIASMQALFLAYQNHQLKHKHLRGILGILPPLQTMEVLLFELLWAGEILLTLSIISGAIFIESLFGQHLAHKTVFSLLSWLIYAVLLWGRHTLGWRGSAAIRWTLGGFAALMLAYFGSKLVLEVILNRG